MNLKIQFLIIIGLSIHSLQAQESINTSGGGASGTGGTASYSVGQIVYATKTDGTISIAEGAQQAYEISVVTGLEKAKDISVSISAYPNPTTNYIIVDAQNYETSNLQFVVIDINGKSIQSIKATGNKTQIETKELTPGNYFVKVLDKQKEIKVFKIVKSK